MSLYDEVQKVLIEYSSRENEPSICEKYEEASKSFDLLVRQGMAEHRGYQLLSIENRMSDKPKVNYKTINP